MKTTYIIDFPGRHMSGGFRVCDSALIAPPKPATWGQVSVQAAGEHQMTVDLNPNTGFSPLLTERNP